VPALTLVVPCLVVVFEPLWIAGFAETAVVSLVVLAAMEEFAGLVT
jgi:hypothetical protein